MTDDKKEITIILSFTGDSIKGLNYQKLFFEKDSIYVFVYFVIMIYFHLMAILNTMHSMGFIHNDLSHSNVLSKLEQNCKYIFFYILVDYVSIIDFGISTKYLFH